MVEGLEVFALQGVGNMQLCGELEEVGGFLCE